MDMTEPITAPEAAATRAAFEHMPPEAPLAMPVQSLTTTPQSRIHAALRRLAGLPVPEAARTPALERPR